jgi:hypothetical protein
VISPGAEPLAVTEFPAGGVIETSPALQCWVDFVAPTWTIA